MSMAVDRVAMLQNVFGTTGRIVARTVPDDRVRTPTARFAAPAIRHDGGEGAPRFRGLARRRRRHSREGRPAAPVQHPRADVERCRACATRCCCRKQFRKIGAQADIEQLDGNDASSARSTATSTPSCGASAPIRVRAASKQIWGTAGIGASGQNFLRYSNPKVDALLDSATASFDPAKMQALLVARVPNDRRRRARDLALRSRAIYAREPPRQCRAAARRTAGGPTSPTGRFPADKRIDRDRIGLRPRTP